ncbi:MULTISPECIES: glycosyltransferase family 2 protein [Clostridium]|uniref:glycosyltransferase family 2 protein n=1 Tax=Clostridium TaxID=1485 RepID=UPI0008268E18|nr:MULTISPECIES: glycosyltransferase [Clostridium]PJI09695.1 glycosyl transferase [Clostridium sp. CT7]
MEDKIKVSVLIVTYNHSRFIKEAMDSALMQQTKYKYEIVVMNDHSSDNTFKILKMYKLKYGDKIRIFNNSKNFGITKNYKLGFEKCRGEYIAVLEGDDYWNNRKKLQIQSDFLDKHRNYSAVFNRYIIYDAAKNLKTVIPWQYRYSEYKKITINDLTIRNVIGNFSACMYRKSIVEQLKKSLYNMVTYDWMFNMAVSEKAPIAYLPQVTSVYRIHRGGVWSGIDKESRLKMVMKQIDDYDKFFGFKYSRNFNFLKKGIYDELIRLKNK